MRRRLVVLFALLFAFAFVACGDDDDDEAADTGGDTEESSTTEAPAEEPETSDATLAVADTELGEVLVDAEGRTLYLFTNDTGTTSSCTGQCASTWPALTAEGEPTAGEGVDEALLGTTERDDGSTQVTYSDHPLYLFSGDEAAGDTNGQGVGGVWFAVTPAGEQAAE